MESWRLRDMERQGEVETLETWRHGDIERWRQGHGNIKGKTENGSPGDFP
jgi:hypothetical protein